MSGGLLMLLKELCTFLPKSKIKAGEGLNNGKYPFFTSSDTKRQYLNDYLFDTEAVILGTGGTASCNYCKGKFATSTDNFVLETNSILKPKYLYYFLRKNNLSILSNGFKGSGLKHISKDYVGKIDISLKTIDHQNQIIKILDDLNGLILNEEKNIEKYNTLIKSRFIEMFENKGFSFLPFSKYADIIDGDRGKNYPKATDFSDNGYCLFLNAKNVTKEGFSFEQTQFISKEKDAALRKGKLQRKDIVITTRGTIGNIAYYDETIPYDNIRINSGMVIIRRQNISYNPFFFLYAFRNKVEEIKAKNVTGVAQPQLPIHIMSKIQLLNPPIELQNEFAEFVELIDKLKFSFLIPSKKIIV